MGRLGRRAVALEIWPTEPLEHVTVVYFRAAILLQAHSAAGPSRIQAAPLLVIVHKVALV